MMMYEQVVTAPGADLATDLYLPSDAAKTRLPTLLLRTPYGRRDLPQRIQELNILNAHEEGFAVAFQDVRGCGDSTGVFDAKRSDGADGARSIEWIRQQGWSDGNVATIGASFGSMVQFLTAQQQPPGLRAIAPMMGGSERDLWIAGGAMRLGGITAWVAGYITQEPLSRAVRPDERNALEDYLAASPLERLHMLLTPGSHVRATTKALGAWFTDDPEEPFWTRVALPGEVALPSIHLSGWYDVCLDTTVDAYERMRENDESHAHELIIGPWPHAFPSHDGSVECNCNGAFPIHGDDPVDAERRILRFLRDAINGRDRAPEDAVRVFVLGANAWRSHSSWPPPDAHRVQWLLCKTALGGCGSGGLIRIAPGEAACVTYRYDPRDPVPTAGGATCIMGRYGPHDVSKLHLRSDVLLFTSEPMEQDMELAGRVSAVLAVDSSAVDTDFVARLIVLRPNGEAIPLCHGYWSGRLTDLPMVSRTARARHCSIAMGHTCVRVCAGDRLGLQVTSSDYPEIYPNANTGHRVRDGVPMHTAIADQTVVVGGISGSMLCVDVRPAH